MNVTVIDSGFVSGDFLLKPLGYAGEMNSRKIYITHPHFKDCYYQLLIQRYDGLYRVGIQDGECLIPPSLMRTATDLKCHFVAISTPESVTNAETDTFLFESAPFTVKVAEGLAANHACAIPTYEELQRMYNNIADAQAAVDKAKEDNEMILAQIEAALKKAHEEPIAEISAEVLEQYRQQFADMCEDYLADGFFDDVAAEVVARVGECSCGDVGKMSTEELKAMIESIVAEMKTEVSNGTASWLTTTHHFMSKNSNIIGG